MSIDPGETAEWQLPARYANGVPARREVTTSSGSYLGGPLDAGDYYVVVAVPGLGGSFSLLSPVTITEHLCGGFSTDFVERYIFERSALAQAQARRDGMTLRVVVEEGVELPVTEDHRCDRVNVAVEDGRIVEVVGIG